MLRAEAQTGTGFTTMSVDWQVMDQHAGADLLRADHSLHHSPLFCDASLAALLDAYPREKLGVWTFGEHGEGEDKPVRGTAEGLSGQHILEAVQNGRIWLNLRATNDLVADYSGVANSIFDSLQARIGHRAIKRDMSVLISSPGIHVHYHLDIPLVALLQVRGKKTLHVYPATDPFAPTERLEAIALGEGDETLVFQDTFEASATAYELSPGMGLSWPQNAPHRVQNGDMMNVSLSCEFMTWPALLRANALYANGRLRRSFGARPGRPEGLVPATLGKAALARVFKKLDRNENTSPTPASFALDLSRPSCTRPLSA